MNKVQWGTKSPGLLIFLIDQSGSMITDNLHIKVANAVQNAVYECLLGCVSGCDIKNRFYLRVIGYGDTIQDLWKGWIGEEKLIEKLQYANDNNTSFIPAVADGVTPMSEAFYKAKDYVNKWLNDCKKEQEIGNLNGIPAPIVVNITDGMPCEYHYNDVESKKRATAAAKELMEITTPNDGNVLLFNLHLSANDVQSLQFPKDISELDGSEQARFLYEISSSLDNDMVTTAKICGLETARIGSRGMITNASGSIISKFISFGSQVSGVVNNG